MPAAGRMMRCAQCAYTWWHHPHSAPTPQHVQAQSTAQQASVAQTQAPAQAPVPAPAPMPEPEEEEVEVEEEEYEEEELEEVEEEVEEESESEEPELSDEEIEEAFGTDEPDPIESMTDAPQEDRATEDDEQEIDPDLIPDPEPLPDSLTAPDDDDEDEDDEEEEGGSRLGLIIAMVGVGLLLVLVAVFFLMSKQIASWVPATASIYESIGLNHKSLGEGLEIQNIKWERVTLKNKSEGLAVRASIKNVTKEKKSVPYVRVTLLNNEDKPVQAKDVKPRKSTIDPGRSIIFRYQFDEPAATARRGILGFTEGPAMKKDGAAKPKEKPKADAKKK